MKIFLSWSGERSHEVAKLFSEWLPQVVQYVEPWLSSESIDAGSIWDNAIQDSLQSTNMGIVFLTQENKEKPWILFESGALSKGLSLSRVFTFLIDLKPDDFLKNPLSKFNHTFNNKISIYKLLIDINNNADESQKLKGDVLKKVFDKNYDELEQSIEAISKLSPTPLITEISKQEAMISEVLHTVRDIERKISDNSTQTITNTKVKFVPIKLQNRQYMIGEELYRKLEEYKLQFVAQYANMPTEEDMVGFLAMQNMKA